MSMKVKIEFELSKDELHEMDRIFALAPRKIRNQLERSPECICTAPEDDDVIRNINGRIIGTIEIERTTDE